MATVSNVQPKAPKSLVYTAIVSGLIAFVLLVFTGLALGWRARRRRQAGLPALDAPPASLGAPLIADDVFYVATTVAEAPTDRIAG